MLKEIFKAITPDNIQDIQVIEDAMDIFIANLEEKALVSKDIRNIFESDNTNVQEAVLKTFLFNLYCVVDRAQKNRTVLDKIQQTKDLFGDFNSDFFKDIEKFINYEHISNSKNFNQNKGTIDSIKTIYQLVNGFGVTPSKSNEFKIEETLPFHFTIEGVVYRELYDTIVAPMSHPVGFTYTYQQIVKTTLEDLYGIVTTYNIDNIEVRCIQGGFEIYTEDLNDINVKAEFLTRLNPNTLTPYTEDYYNTYVNVITNKKVIDIMYDDEDSRTYNGILFDDNTILEQFSNPIEVVYRNESDSLNDDEYIKKYNNDEFEHCSLYLKYTSDFSYNYSDDVSFLVEMNITAIEEGSGGLATPGHISDLIDISDYNDELNIITIGAGGYLATSDNNYIYLTDDFYLTLYEDI